MVKLRQRDSTVKIRPISGGSETSLCGYTAKRVLNTTGASLHPIITLYL